MVLQAGSATRAQFSLYDNHTCAEIDHPGGTETKGQLEMQGIALEGVKTAGTLSHIPVAVGEIRCCS